MEEVIENLKKHIEALEIEIERADCRYSKEKYQEEKTKLEETIRVIYLHGKK